jgi:CelD/BcsL family acetyltransferase involved in cellulose biosynthesis
VSILNTETARLAGQGREGAGPTVELIGADAALADDPLLNRWHELLDYGSRLNRVWSSPRIFSDQHGKAPLQENCVAVVRDEHGAVVGLCPIVHWRLTLPFQFRRRILGRIRLRAATILGGEPLLPPDPALHERLFAALDAGLPWCDCIYINSMPVGSFIAKFIYQQGELHKRFLVHPVRLEPREWIYLELGSSMDEFLREKQKRTRNTLKRRVKKLREHGGGALECIRVEHEDQVDAFYTAALAVAERSWQFQSLGQCLEETALYQESLRNQARLGSLRAYLLNCGGKPCAFVIGYQEDDVLQFEQTAYAAEFAHYSPGTVLYFLLLEDLYHHRKPSFVNHGVGTTPHKRIFTNRTAQDACVHLFRPTLRNRLRCLSHQAFYAGLKLAKRIRSRPAPQNMGEDESDD